MACCDKLPQAPWLKILQIYCVAILKVRVRNHPQGPNINAVFLLEAVRIIPSLPFTLWHLEAAVFLSLWWHRHSFGFEQLIPFSLTLTISYPALQRPLGCHQTHLRLAPQSLLGYKGCIYRFQTRIWAPLGDHYPTQYMGPRMFPKEQSSPPAKQASSLQSGLELEYLESAAQSVVYAQPQLAESGL